MNQYPPIVVAARSWDVQLMRTELAAGADPHLRTGYADSPLIVVIFRNMLKVRSAGGWGRYERACRARLAKTLARVVFPGLPTDTVSHVVHFAFHTGYY